MAIDYKQAGVDVERGYEAVERMQSHVARTMNNNVHKGLANFGGLYRLPQQPDGTMLVAGTDGVGTKLKLAFELDRHNTVGIDCVAMCVNDVLCHGAQPIIFLDYIATGRLKPEQVEQIVAGIAEGCVQSGCVLLGGETAEMPGFYAAGEYDLAGFAVGTVSPRQLIDGSSVEEGDLIIGLASSGAHSNGYSLLRKLFLNDSFDLCEAREDLGGRTLGEALLEPTKIYVKPIQELLKICAVHGLAHITGGGFFENIPRVLPEGLCAEISIGSWEVPLILQLAQKTGEIEEKDMYSTFNMGIGFIVIASGEEAEKALAVFKDMGEKAIIIGKVSTGKRGVSLCR